MNRRLFIASAGAGVAALGRPMPQGPDVPEVIRKLKPMTDGIQPITDEERHARIEKARRLMRQNKMDAVVMAGGSSLFYFTGSRAAEVLWILPAAGAPVWVAQARPARHDDGVHF